jgi:conserved oligomeric Golgi complex subunit 6
LNTLVQLEATKASSAAQTKLIESLEEQIKTLENHVAASKDSIEALKASHTSDSAEAVAAASLEHEALLKAQENFAAIQKEIDAVKEAHTAALDEAHQKLRVSEEKLESVHQLEQQIAELQKEKEESANKVSELEVEILELKESQEGVGDEREASAAKVTALEEELSKVKASVEKALEERSALEVRHAEERDQTRDQHDEAIRKASEDHAAALAQLESLRADLSAATAAHEDTKVASQAAADAHLGALEELEKKHQNTENRLSEQIKTISAELAVLLFSFFIL